MTVLRGRDIGRVGGVEGPRQGPSPAEWLRAEAELTPKVRLLLEFNKIRFHHPEALQTVLFQDKIRSECPV